MGVRKHSWPVLGAVALVHLAGWQLLSRDWRAALVSVVSNPVAVRLLDAPQNQLSPKAAVDMPQEIQITQVLSVAVPEVQLEADLSRVDAQPAIASPVSVANQPSQSVSVANAVAVHSDAPQVVSESEVDYLERPKIAYPQAAKRLKEQGVVMLAVLVDQLGRVQGVSVWKTSGSPRLDDAALRSVRSSLRVRPYLRAGVAIPVEIRIPVEFSLLGAV